MQHVFYLRNDGLHGGEPAGAGIFGDSHAGFADRSLRLSNSVGDDHISGIPHTGSVVSVLSGVLADHRRCTPDLFYLYSKEISEKGYSGSGPRLEAALYPEAAAWSMELVLRYSVGQAVFLCKRFQNLSHKRKICNMSYNSYTGKENGSRV